MFHVPAVGHSNQPAALHEAGALLSFTHFVLAVAIALSAFFGSYAGGDWTWWLGRASSRRKRP